MTTLLSAGGSKFGAGAGSTPLPLGWLGIFIPGGSDFPDRREAKSKVKL